MAISMEEYADQNSFQALSEAPKNRPTKSSVMRRAAEYAESTRRYDGLDQIINTGDINGYHRSGAIIDDATLNINPEALNQLRERFMAGDIGVSSRPITRTLRLGENIAEENPVDVPDYYVMQGMEIQTPDELLTRMRRGARSLIEQSERYNIPTGLPTNWESDYIPIHCVEYDGNGGRGTVFESLDGGETFTILDESYLDWLNHQSPETLRRITLISNEPDGAGIQLTGLSAIVQRLRDKFNALALTASITNIEAFREWVESDQILNRNRRAVEAIATTLRIPSEYFEQSIHENISEGLNEDRYQGQSIPSSAAIVIGGGVQPEIPDYYPPQGMTEIPEIYDDNAEAEARSRMRYAVGDPRRYKRSPRYG